MNVHYLFFVLYPTSCLTVIFNVNCEVCVFYQSTRSKILTSVANKRVLQIFFVSLCRIVVSQEPPDD